MTGELNTTSALFKIHDYHLLKKNTNVKMVLNVLGKLVFKWISILLIQVKLF